MSKKVIMIPAFVNLDQVAEDVGSLDDKTVLNFIKQLDLSQEDWGFTEAVTIHFLKQFNKLNKEDWQISEPSPEFISLCKKIVEKAEKYK